MDSMIQRELPGARKIEIEADAVWVDWNCLFCAARQRLMDGKWIVVVHDLSDPDLEIDDAPVLEGMASDQVQAIEMQCRLAKKFAAERFD